MSHRRSSIITETYTRTFRFTNTVHVYLVLLCCSQDIASQFLDGATTVDEFLSTFLKESTNSHSLKVKTDKLRAIATRLRQGLPLDDVAANRNSAQPRTNFYSGVQSDAYSATPSFPSAMSPASFYR